MGYPYHELIPSAILLENPGITREEFVRLLNKTDYHEGKVREDEEKYPWDLQTPDGLYVDRDFHTGLHGLAHILGLNYREEYLFYGDEYYARNNRNPGYHTYARKENGKWENQVHVVNEGRDFLMFSELKQLTEEHYEDVRYFLDLDGLVKEYRQFSPDYMYDFSQDSGSFTISGAKNSIDFRWVKRGDLYYLDEKTFRRIPANGGMFIYGYTDLMLTAEAIKQKAWKLLSRKGLEHLEDFYKDFSESRIVLEEAIWNGHSSLYAKKQGMSHTELLRWRLIDCKDDFIEPREKY
ncbi:MAG TPA: hypothetical protein HA226_01740 [Nanoarchaeota archaeon]|nr:MAG: hypothetical protein QT09_C0007G0028 [archaeon GW2011_AR18]HIH25474.1 hypothetical protein [Nanoarchaeota archaeon]